MRQSVRCIALGLVSAAAIAGATLPASAGLLDGWWGCGCGGPSYVVVPDYVAPAFVAPVPAVVYPQMQVVVIRTIASRGSSIFGSGTVSTRTSLLPCQQRALMLFPPVLRSSEVGLIAASGPEGAYRWAAGNSPEAVRRLGPSAAYC